MIDYALILTTNYVGKQWSLSGDSYNGLEWLDTSPKPTKAELDVLWESTQTAQTAKKEAKTLAKASALSKLTALGLTADEVKALLGEA
jgi:hypothetical protein